MGEVDYPKDRGVEDVAHGAATAAVNLVPGAGGALATVMHEVWTPALERRRTRWFQQLSDDVATLAGEVGDLEARLADEAVLDLALQAAERATRTRHEDRRYRLRAVVLNSALGRGAAGVDEAERFLGLMDELSERHVVMLSFLDDPRGYAERAGVHTDRALAGTLSAHLERVFPDWSREDYDDLVAELDQARLSDAGAALHTVMTESGTLARRTTERGRRFLVFVTHPLEDAGRT